MFHHLRRLFDYQQEPEQPSYTRAPDEPPGLSWAGMESKRSHLGAHYGLIGAPGSGKSSVLRCLLQSALRLGGRAIVHDRKREYLSDIAATGRKAVVLNPFDGRGVRYDLARDIRDRAQAGGVASILLNAGQSELQRSDHQPYFRDAAWEIARAAIISLQENFSIDWQLRDLLECCQTEARLRVLLSLSEPGRVALELHANEQSGSAWPNVLATLRTRLVAFEDVGLVWEKAAGTFSIEQWMKEKSVVVLGYDHLRAPAVEALNRALFERASQAVLASVGQVSMGSDGLLPSSEESWLVIDEATELGRISVRSTMNEGRAAGVHVVLGFQELAGLQRVYGKEEADEILAACDQLAILRQNHPGSREWAAQWVGQIRDWETSYSSTHGASRSQSTSRSLALIPTILPQEFRDFPKASFATGVHAIASSATIPPWRMHVTPEELAALPKEDPSTPRFIPRDPDDYKPRPWVGPVAKRIQQSAGGDGGTRWPMP